LNTLKSLFLQVQWLHNEVKNPYVSRNIGIKQAKGTIIGFLDAKCSAKPNWLESAMTYFADKENVIVAGAYDVMPPSAKLRDLIYPILYLNNQKNVEKDFGVTTGNLLVPRTIFRTEGVFDTDHISGNDIKWTKKALKAGITIRYAPDVIVEYRGQSYELLSGSIKKYISGIYHQKRKERRDILNHLRQVFKYLLPMRRSYFNEALRYRDLEKKSLWDKCYLWILVWSVKIRMALHYLQCLTANGEKK